MGYSCIFNPCRKMSPTCISLIKIKSKKLGNYYNSNSIFTSNNTRKNKIKVCQRIVAKYLLNKSHSITCLKILGIKVYFKIQIHISHILHISLTALIIIIFGKARNFIFIRKSSNTLIIYIYIYIFWFSLSSNFRNNIYK